MHRRRAQRLARILLVVLPCTQLACATWSRTREEVIDPLHALLHHDYPHAIAEGDRGAVAQLFAPGAPPEATAPSFELLESFAEVERAWSMIEHVHLEEDPVRAELSIRVDGTGRDGRLRTVFQEKEVTVARGPDGWRMTGDRPGPVREAETPAARFVDEALLRGLWFQHEGRPVFDPEGEPQRYVYGSGVAAADVDGDGWDDALLANGDRISLFHNEGGSFRDVSESWGLGAPLLPEGAVLTVILPVDFDGDGRRDLFVGAEFGQPLLLRNRGDRFVPVPDSGIETSERTVSAVAADFDGDGWVDLFLANHEDVYHEAPNPPWSENAEADQLFLNQGDGTFRDATRRAHVGNEGWSLTPVAADYDLDGDVDLFVGNDYGRDALFRNDGTGRFEEVSSDAGVTAPVAAMGADWGDWDGDGDFDLFVSGMKSGSGWVLEAPDFRIRKVPWIVDALFRPHVREYVRSWFQGNRFYENQGDGSFREIAEQADAANNGWAWAAVWLDFDNDGLLDVYALNGFLSGPIQDDL